MLRLFLGITASVVVANAHIALWHPSMWCFNGSRSDENNNADTPTTPLYQLDQKDWFLHQGGDGNCRDHPPAPGQFLELPANGQLQAELASNRAVTSWSYEGRYSTPFVDGKRYTDPDNWTLKPPACVTDPNLHAESRLRAEGTALAISYTSDLSKVTPENLVVISVLYNSPWLYRLVTYFIPNLPACPPGGCICAWGWIPNGCGTPNMYHFPYRCKVTGANSTTPLAAPKPPVWCEEDEAKCTRGAKQMLAWNQNNGNNIQVSGKQLNGDPKSPAYNMKCGFRNGAQNDIFESAIVAPTNSSSLPAATSSTVSPSSTAPASTESGSASTPVSTSSTASPSSTAPASTESGSASTPAATSSTASPSQSAPASTESGSISTPPATSTASPSQSAPASTESGSTSTPVATSSIASPSQSAPASTESGSASAPAATSSTATLSESAPAPTDNGTSSSPAGPPTTALPDITSSSSLSATPSTSKPPASSCTSHGHSHGHGHHHHRRRVSSW